MSHSCSRRGSAFNSNETSSCDWSRHVFAQQFPNLTSEGRERVAPKVAEHMWAARERGVLFDLGHGGGSFWFRNAVPALQDGFPPDSISTEGARTRQSFAHLPERRAGSSVRVYV